MDPDGLLPLQQGGVSEPQWLTPLFQTSLQYLALPKEHKARYLPFVFEGPVVLDHGYEVQLEDPLELLLFFLRDHMWIPELWDSDPEFTALELAGSLEALQKPVQNIRETLQTLHWQDLLHHPLLQNWALEALALLQWPAEPPARPAVDLLDEYTYHGFSEVACPVRLDQGQQKG